MADIDFCSECGQWVAAGLGTMRNGPDGEAAIICDECLAIEQSRAVPIEPGSRSGMIGDDKDDKDDKQDHRERVVEAVKGYMGQKAH